MLFKINSKLETRIYVIPFPEKNDCGGKKKSFFIDLEFFPKQDNL